MPPKPLLLLPLLLLPACTPTLGHLPGSGFTPPITSNDPAFLLSLLASTTTPETSRKAADAKLITQIPKSNPTRLAVLQQILSSPGHSDTMRLYAIDQLADASPPIAGQTLQLYLPKLAGENNAVLAHACTLLASLGDDRALDPLVRSLHRALDLPNPTPASLRTRPETAAIESLSARPLPEALFSTLADNPIPTTQIAALDLLQTLLPPPQLLARLQQLPANTPQNSVWLADLHWYLSLFSTPPLGQNESTWMHQLHLPENTPLLTRAQLHHQLLASQPDYHFAPRFISTLAFTDQATLQLPRETLIATLQSQLAKVPHHPRTPQYPGSPDDIDQSLSANLPKLSRLDLLTLRLLLQTLTTPAALAELQRQGLQDLSDTTTEHGGLLLLENPSTPNAPPTLLITSYPPLYPDNDFTYLSSDSLLQHSATALAQYHFHFQQIHNAPRAGPGEGDLTYAANNHINCVVITSTNTHQLNLDYYTPTSAVIDLGTYQTQTP